MKKIVIFTVSCIMLGPNAMAIKKCVQYGNGTTCASTASDWLGKADWKATCTTNGNTENVIGVAACSNSETLSNDTLSSVGTSSATDNVNCWCKMLIPAESSWFTIYKGASASDCAYSCASKCADAIVSNAAFRNALFFTTMDN